MKKKFIAASVLAAISLALIVGLGVFVWSRETEVEQLMEIVAAGDRPDATWAFEKLKEVSRERLDEFLPYLSSTRPIPLEDMAATFPDGPLFNGIISGPGTPWELSKVAQFFLSTRLTGDIEIDRGDPGTHLVPRWRKELESRVREGAPGPQESWFARHVLPPPRVLPPSRDPRLARLAKDFDVEGLLAVVQSDVIPEVMWAVEALELAPDDRLDLLLPRLADTEKVAVRSLYGKHANGGGAGQVCPDGRPFGAVTRFLLGSRLSLAAPMDPAVWTEDAVSPEALDGLRAAWLEYRASKSGG